MHKKDLQKVSQPDEPLVEIKIYVEQSVVNSIGGIEKAKLIAYWSLVNEAEPDENTVIE